LAAGGRKKAEATELLIVVGGLGVVLNENGLVDGELAGRRLEHEHVLSDAGDRRGFSCFVDVKLHAGGRNVGRHELVVINAVVVRLKQLRTTARLIVFEDKMARGIAGRIAERLHSALSRFHERDADPGLWFAGRLVEDSAVDGGEQIRPGEES